MSMRCECGSRQNINSINSSTVFDSNNSVSGSSARVPPFRRMSEDPAVKKERKRVRRNLTFGSENDQTNTQDGGVSSCSGRNSATDDERFWIPGSLARYMGYLDASTLDPTLARSAPDSDPSLNRYMSVEIRNNQEISLDPTKLVPQNQLPPLKGHRNSLPGIVDVKIVPRKLTLPTCLGGGGGGGQNSGGAVTPDGLNGIESPGLPGECSPTASIPHLGSMKSNFLPRNESLVNRESFVPNVERGNSADKVCEVSQKVPMQQVGLYGQNKFLCHDNQKK